MYRVVYTVEADKQLEAWYCSGQKKTVQKINRLLDELEEHPRTGTGKPEQLKGQFPDLWSRRIDKKNRLLYSIHDDRVVVEVIALRGHYADK